MSKTVKISLAAILGVVVLAGAAFLVVCDSR